LWSDKNIFIDSVYSLTEIENILNQRTMQLVFFDRILNHFIAPLALNYLNSKLCLNSVLVTIIGGFVFLGFAVVSLFLDPN
jgi:predicted ATPase